MNIGDKVPQYLGVDEAGKEWHAADMAGRYWVLYFYPKDNTSGCTAEACSLQEAVPRFEQLNIPIIGVSKDSAASHKKFKAAHNLAFPLLVDAETRLQQEMGVWVPKSMYGKTYMGTLRSTFIVDPQGTIIHKMQGKEIKTAQHAAQLLQWLRENNIQ